VPTTDKNTLAVAYPEGVRGLEPLPLAYDLRNKCARMHQMWYFQQKYAKIFWGGAPFSSGEGDTPSECGN